MSKVSQIIIGSLLTLGSLLVPVPEVKANTYEEHQELRNTLEEIGVTTLVNSTDVCSSGENDGVYFYLASTLVVCQDLAGFLPIGAKEVGWTENDYDTLRHEAHHVVQDCMVGGLADGKSGLLFEDIDRLKEFVNGALTKKEIQIIVNEYRKGGADDDLIMREIEAFAVARSVRPSSISNALRKVCGR